MEHRHLEVGIFTSTVLAALAFTTTPTCSDLLDGMRAKVEANYAGYLLEVRGARRAAYDVMLADARRMAADTSGDACLDVLQRYIAWFDDPHLFVFQSTSIDTAETRARMAAVPWHPVDEAAVREALRAKGTAADPIEGIWHDGAMRLAVVPDPDGTAGRFVAVVVSSDTVTLANGAVHAVFDRRPDGGYAMSLRWRSLAITRPAARLHRSGMLLRASPAMWAKAWPVSSGEHAAPDTTDVRRPTFAMVGDVPVLAIPSHQFQYRRVLDSLIGAHRAQLQGATHLVVDLRGNEGGGSQMSNGLLPYVLGSDMTRGDGDFGNAVMISSADQITYARRAFGADTSKFVRRLVTALEAAPGELVPLFDPAEPVPTTTDPAPVFGPRRVAILVDGGTVSASEVLVQKALRTDRAVVIGEPTAGALDYQSTFIVRLHPDESRWFLGYPTITAHARLPEGGMRGKGIAPEVAVDWAAIDDPVATAVERLSRLAAREST